MDRLKRQRAVRDFAAGVRQMAEGRETGARCACGRAAALSWREAGTDAPVRDSCAECYMRDVVPRMFPR